jgi:hypothetical protein
MRTCNFVYFKKNGSSPCGLLPFFGAENAAAWTLVGRAFLRIQAQMLQQCVDSTKVQVLGGNSTTQY